MTNMQRRLRDRSRWLVADVPARCGDHRRLREAGAVILGKANLGEWANFRGSNRVPLAVGWSARGGITTQSIRLELYDPWGSSSGSANGGGRRICARSRSARRRMDQSLGHRPSRTSLGLKPTLGLVSQDGIIPIAHSRTQPARWAAALPTLRLCSTRCSRLRSRNWASACPMTIRRFLRRGSTRRRAHRNATRAISRKITAANPIWWRSRSKASTRWRTGCDHCRHAIPAIHSLTTSSSTTMRLTALLYEFKGQIAQYLATLTNTHHADTGGSDRVQHRALPGEK